jgi:hypothetical protein
MVMFTCNIGGMVVRGYAKGSAPGKNQEEVQKAAARAAFDAFPECKGKIETPEKRSLLERKPL